MLSPPPGPLPSYGAVLAPPHSVFPVHLTLEIAQDLQLAKAAAACLLRGIHFNKHIAPVFPMLIFSF